MSFDSLDLVRRFGAPLWCAALARHYKKLKTFIWFFICCGQKKSQDA